MEPPAAAAPYLADLSDYVVNSAPPPDSFETLVTIAATEEKATDAALSHLKLDKSIEEQAAAIILQQLQINPDLNALLLQLRTRPDKDILCRASTKLLLEQGKVKEAYRFVREIENRETRISIILDIMNLFAPADAFDELLDATTWLEERAANLIKYRTAIFYLNNNNIDRVFQLYFSITNLSSRSDIFHKAYDQLETAETKKAFADKIITKHLTRDEAEQAMDIVKKLDKWMDPIDAIYSMGIYMIQTGLLKKLPLIMQELPLPLRTKLSLTIPPPKLKARAPKKKSVKHDSDEDREDSVIVQVLSRIESGKDITDLLIAFRGPPGSVGSDFYRVFTATKLLDKNRPAEAFFFTREVSDETLKILILETLIEPLVKADAFDQLKECFTHFKLESIDMYKFCAANAYLSQNNILRPLEIYPTITTFETKMALFSQMFQKAILADDKIQILNRILAMHLDHNDVESVVHIIKNLCPGIDPEVALVFVGTYLIQNHKLEKINLVLDNLTTRRAELEALLPK